MKKWFFFLLLLSQVGMASAEMGPTESIPKIVSVKVIVKKPVTQPGTLFSELEVTISSCFQRDLRLMTSKAEDMVTVTIIDTNKKGCQGIARSPYTYHFALSADAQNEKYILANPIEPVVYEEWGRKY